VYYKGVVSAAISYFSNLQYTYFNEKTKLFYSVKLQTFCFFCILQSVSIVLERLHIDNDHIAVL